MRLGCANVFGRRWGGVKTCPGRKRKCFETLKRSYPGSGVCFCLLSFSCHVFRFFGADSVYTGPLEPNLTPNYTRPFFPVSNSAPKSRHTSVYTLKFCTADDKQRMDANLAESTHETWKMERLAGCRIKKKTKAPRHWKRTGRMVQKRSRSICSHHPT